MRIFRKKPFYWGTKEVVRYLRYKYSGHDLVQRLAVYNALCEIESDFDGKPITSFAKVISRYSGIKRQSINTIIKEFQQLGIVSTYRRPKKDGKFGCKYLVLEDKVPSVPKKDTGESSLKLPLFGDSVDKKEPANVPITNVGKQDIIKKVNSIEVKYNHADGKPSAKDIVNYFFELKGWANKDKDFYKENRIVYSRFMRPAKQLLELCGNDFDKAKSKLLEIKKWAESKKLEWGIETVIKRWFEIGKKNKNNEILENLSGERLAKFSASG